MREFTLVICALCLFSSDLYAEEGTSGKICVDGKCIPVNNSNVQIDTKKINALANSAVTRAVNASLEKDEKRVRPFVKKVNVLEKQVADQQTNLGLLNKEKAENKERVDKANERAAKLEQSVVALTERLAKVQLNANDNSNELKALRSRKITLDMGVYGALVEPFDASSVGLFFSLALPLGEDALWKARLSGGVGPGVAPVGLGWLAAVSVTRDVGQHFSVGPALLATGNEKDLRSSSRIFGGGVEFRFIYERFFLSVTPFLGVALRKNDVGSDWREAVYETAPCDEHSTAVVPCGVEYNNDGSGTCTHLVQEEGFDRYYSKTRVRLGGGFELALGYTFFVF